MKKILLFLTIILVFNISIFSAKIIFPDLTFYKSILVNNNIFCFSYRTILILDKNTGNFITYNKDEYFPSAIFEYQNEIWIGTENEIYIYEKKFQSKRKISGFQGWILNISEYENGFIAITNTKKIYFIDKKDNISIIREINKKTDNIIKAERYKNSFLLLDSSKKLYTCLIKENKDMHKMNNVIDFLIYNDKIVTVDNKWIVFNDNETFFNPSAKMPNILKIKKLFISNNNLYYLSDKDSIYYYDIIKDGLYQYNDQKIFKNGYYLFFENSQIYIGNGAIICDKKDKILVNIEFYSYCAPNDSLLIQIDNKTLFEYTSYFSNNKNYLINNIFQGLNYVYLPISDLNYSTKNIKITLRRNNDNDSLFVYFRINKKNIIEKFFPSNIDNNLNDDYYAYIFVDSLNYIYKNDANLFKYIFNKWGVKNYNIKFINLNEDNFNKFFGDAGELIRCNLKKIFIFFAANGYLTENGNKYYYILKNSSVVRIHGILNSLPAEKIYFIYDGEFTGEIKSPTYKSDIKAEMSLLRENNKKIFYLWSNLGYNKSFYDYELGYTFFSYSLANALKNSQDNNNDDLITLNEFEEYVEQSVDLLARLYSGYLIQKPLFINIYKKNEILETLSK